MKPLELHLAAFGQYLEPQTVRFDKLDAVFLVTGETGAGKTTLFDAISYALYGRGLGARKSELGLRSQLAGEETSTVVRFRFAVRGVQWLVERSPYQFVRRKRTGAVDTDSYVTLQRLSGPDAPQSIPPKEVDGKIRQIVGLRYEDFSKILVLPQGEFQQFLAMNSKERAGLLKTLFPVSQHEALARMAKEAVRDVKAAVDALDAVIKEWTKNFNEAGFVDDERELLAQLAVRVADEQRKQAERELAADALQQVRTLAQQIAQLREGRTELSRLELSRPERDAQVAERNAAQRAAAVLPVVERAQTLAAELRTLGAQLLRAREEEDQAANHVARLQPEIDLLPMRRSALEQARSEAEALGRRASDLRLLQTAIQAARVAQDDAERLSAGRDQARTNWEATTAALAALDVVAMQRDAGRPALDAAVAALRDCRLSEQDARTLEAWLTTRHAELQAGIEREQATLARFARRLDDAEQAVQASQGRLQANAALVVAASLRPGEPCLACGSLDHPRPNRGNPEDGDLVALVRQAESAWKNGRDAHGAQDKLVAQMRASHQTEALVVQQAGERLARAGHADAPAWRATLVQVETALQSLQAQDMALATRLAQRPRESDAVRHALGVLDQAGEALQAAQNRQAGAVASVAGIRARVGDVLDVQRELLDSQRQQDAAVAANKTEETAIAQIQADWQRVERALAGATAARETVAKAHGEKRDALPAAELALAQALLDGGFASIAEVRAAARSAPEQSALHDKIMAWERRLSALQDATGRLLGVIDGRAEPDVEAAEKHAAAATEAAQNATESRVAKQNERDALRETAKRLAEKRAERERTVAETKGLLTLSSHLNGERAPKIDFSTWMLTWWLERVLMQANRRMAALTDGRYTFALRTTVEDGRAKAGLDVDVLDTWSNQRRDVNALSGGEKFLASLSLALGLADVVQGLNGGVQLDTLFIDEGFGSLDANTLDRAMDLVNQIAEHRAVGLISHVEAMQRAIASQIRVRKSPKGSVVHVAAAGEP